VPKIAARSRRSIATVTSTAVISASVAVLLLPVTAPPAGAAAAPGSTQRASLKSPGDTPAENGAQDSALSGNGESVAFTSQSQLDPTIKTGSGTSAPNYKNVFVRDLVKRKTVMISRGQFDPPPPTSGSGSSGGVHFGPDKLLQLQAVAPPPIKDTEPTDNSYSPSISADGRFVAFKTSMSNMFLEDTSHRSKVVVVDRDPNGDGNYDEEETRSGVLSKIYKYYLISGREGDFGSPYAPKIAGNASRIVWEAYSDGHTSLLSSSLDLRAGTVGAITRVPSAPAQEGFSRTQQDDPAISGDGNHIVMHVQYEDFSCDCNEPEGYHTIQSADMRQENSVIRVDIDGGNDISTTLLEVVQHPAVNVDGSVIAFVLDEHRLVGDDPPSEVLPFEPITFVVLVNDNKITRTDIVSRDNAFNIINGERPGLSSDGRYLAFVTDSVRAHDGTDRGTSEFTCIRPEPESPGLRSEPMLRLNAAQTPRTTCQVVVRDLIVDLDRRINEQSRLPGTLVSANQPGTSGGNGSTVPDVFFSTAPSLSSDGGRVAFDSVATDLVNPEDRHTPQVYVRTLEPNVRGSAVDFGRVQVGEPSPVRTVQLDVVGFGPVTVEQLSTIGANAGDFAVTGQTCTGQTMHEVGSCTASVRFTPTAEGARNAQLLVQSRGGRRATVDLTGTGFPIPNVRGDAVDFDNVQIGDTSTRTTRLTLAGPGLTTIEQLSIIGTNAGEFELGGQTCVGQTLRGNEFCEVSIRFGPTAEGAQTAQLLVQSRGDRRATVDLTGTGTPIPLRDPEFAAGPNPLDFGSRLLLSNGPTLPVTVTNNGEDALRITAVDIVGPGNPEDYRIASSTCGAAVPGGGQCTVNIAFSPKGSGNRQAVLRFTDNAPGGPSHLVGLQGSANQPSITVSPGITPPGRVVTVTGKDFPPGHVVTVKFQDRPGQTSIQAKDDGTFQAPLLIFPKAAPETRTVLATIPEFTDPLGRTTLLIVFPTVSPANFVVRG
jgi:hypothetical protein